MASRTQKCTSGKAQRRMSQKRRPKPKSKPESVMTTKISPQLTWVYPYLLQAKFKMPNLVLPNRIRSHRPSMTRIMRVMGNAYVESKTIVIATHNQITYLDKKGDLKIKKLVQLSKAEMLDTLAHEVAHLTYPRHGYEHESFTRAIFRTFNLKEKCPHCRGTGKVPMDVKF